GDRNPAGARRRIRIGPKYGDLPGHAPGAGRRGDRRWFCVRTDQINREPPVWRASPRSAGVRRCAPAVERRGTPGSLAPRPPRDPSEPDGRATLRVTLQKRRVQRDFGVVKLRYRATGFRTRRRCIKRLFGDTGNLGFQLQMTLGDAEPTLRFVESDGAGSL